MSIQPLNRRRPRWAADRAARGRRPRAEPRASASDQSSPPRPRRHRRPSTGWDTTRHPSSAQPRRELQLRCIRLRTRRRPSRRRTRAPRTTPRSWAMRRTSPTRTPRPSRHHRWTCRIPWEEARLFETCSRGRSSPFERRTSPPATSATYSGTPRRPRPASPSPPRSSPGPRRRAPSCPRRATIQRLTIGIPTIGIPPSTSPRFVPGCERGYPSGARCRIAPRTGRSGPRTCHPRRPRRRVARRNTMAWRS